MRERVTRGKTRPGRLRGLDRALERMELELSRSGGFDVAIDLGFGGRTCTTQEWRASFERAGYTIPVIGVESDKRRALAAQSMASFGLEFRYGGFELPLRMNERPRWIRAMNVLRQYPESDAMEVHRRLGAQLTEHGLLMEGTSSADGSVLVAHWLRRRGEWLAREALVFFTDFSQGFDPLMFGDRLPRDLRAYARQGVAIGSFLRAWSRSCARVRPQLQWHMLSNPQKSAAHRQLWMGSAASLRTQGFVLELWVDELGGYLSWRPSNGVPFAHDRQLQTGAGLHRALFLGHSR